MDTHGNLKLQDFQELTIPQLQEYLSARSINQSGNKDTLARNAFFAYSLNLPIKESEQSEIQQFHADKINKRKLDGGYYVPDPKSLTIGWVIGSTYLPDLTYSRVNKYLREKNAGKAFRGGKSLFESKHITEVRYHNISQHFSLCYVMANCIPEQRVNNPVYDVWVLLEKSNGAG